MPPRRRRDDARHCQHVPRIAGAELHVVDKVLKADFVKDAVGVDEEEEKVVVALEVFLIHLVDQLEGRLLAMSLTAMRESGNRNARGSVNDVDALGIRCERERDTEFVDGIEIQLVFLVAIKGEENVDTGGWIIAVHDAVDSCDEDIGLFSITGHDNDNLGGGDIVKDLLYSFRSAELVGNEMIYAEKPGHCQENGEAPEGKPLEELDHGFRPEPSYLTWERKSHDHDG